MARMSRRTVQLATLIFSRFSWRDLLVAVATVEALVIDPLDLGHQLVIAHCSRTLRAGLGRVVRRGGELQGPADRLDPPSIPSGIDVAHYLLV